MNSHLRLLLLAVVYTLSLSGTVLQSARAQQLAPTITAPIPGTELPGPDVTFTWTAGSVSVRQWRFRAGRSPGSTEFANARLRDSSAQEYRVTGLPTDGSPVYVQLSYRGTRGWVREEYEYRAFNDDTTVNQPPVASDDTAGPLDAGQGVTINVLSNDTDTDGSIDSSTVSVVSGPSAGTVSLLTDGRISYTHNGDSGTGSDSFTYTVLDDEGATSNVATVTIEPIVDLPPENDPPVAADDTVGPVLIGQSLTFDVLNNDTDSDGSLVPATVTIVVQPSAGVALSGADGRITYTHDGTAGTVQDVLTYIVQDDDGAVSNEATVTVRPFNDPEPENQAPIAADDTVGPIEAGQSLSIAVLDNDTDPDGTLIPATVTVISQPAFGTIVIEQDGRISYRHGGDLNTGSDTFTYTVEDDDGAVSNAATVTIAPINDPKDTNIAPVAADDNAGPVRVGETLVFSVTANDSDTDGVLAPETVTIVDMPVQGTATVDTTGQITYVHDGTLGIPTDSLVYTVEDDEGLASNEATVTIQIEPIPSLTTPLLQPLDITFDNPSWTGNAFDVLAIATYTHTASATTRSAELFYAGNDQWTARFVADQTGEWLYRIESEDSELNDHSGAITVTNSTEKGFVVAQGDKWTRSATGEAFVPQYVMAGTLSEFAANPGKIATDLDTFIDGHGFTGFHIRGYCQWFKLGNTRCDIPAEERDPDLETFAVVENIIRQTTARGGSTHIWMYGDNYRNQNPSNWGLNGTEDERVQRYLAARLGPLPGWTLGYGYDISEWASPAEVETWFNNLNARMLYPHLISARSNQNIIMQHTEILTYSSYEQHKPDYSWYVNAIQARVQKPSFAEDRYRVDAGRSVDYSFEETRRGLWHSAMAGGVANIWGNMQFSDGGSYDAGSRVYPNKDELKLYFDYMTPRFSADLQICNALTDGYCLRTPAHSRYIVYKQDTNSISIDLSGMSGTRRYSAMNTLTGETIDGVFSTAQEIWTAPTIADWVIEVLSQ